MRKFFVQGVMEVAVRDPVHGALDRSLLTDWFDTLGILPDILYIEDP